MDDLPPLAEQARHKGWSAGVFDFGKGEAPGTDYFNPSLVERPDGLWLLARRAVHDQVKRWGQNSICAFRLDANKVPQIGQVLRFIGAEPEEHFEDPRAVQHNGRTWVGACNYLFFGDRWTGAHQTLGVFNDDWSCYLRYHPEVGGNGPVLQGNSRHEKNWPWFFHNDRLHLLYQTKPWELIQFGTKWSDRITHRAPGVDWAFGEIRGGTPPVRVGDLYWTFFHSSLPWVGAYRRYYMGALAFAAEPPFAPVRWTSQPMLSGSQHDRWNNRKPPCVFPCGAVLRDGVWLVTYGINDLNCGWVEIPHADLDRLADPHFVVDKKVSHPKMSKKRKIKRRCPPLFHSFRIPQ